MFLSSASQGAMTVRLAPRLGLPSSSYPPQAFDFSLHGPPFPMYRKHFWRNPTLSRHSRALKDDSLFHEGCFTFLGRSCRNCRNKCSGWQIASRSAEQAATERFNKDTVKLHTSKISQMEIGTWLCNAPTVLPKISARAIFFTTTGTNI